MIKFGGEAHTLIAGDSATYDSMALMSIVSTSDEELVMIVAVPPIVLTIQVGSGDPSQPIDALFLGD